MQPFDALQTFFLNHSVSFQILAGLLLDTQSYVLSVDSEKIVAVNHDF